MIEITEPVTAQEKKQIEDKQQKERQELNPGAQNKSEPGAQGDNPPNAGPGTEQDLEDAGRSDQPRENGTPPAPADRRPQDRDGKPQDGGEAQNNQPGNGQDDLTPEQRQKAEEILKNWQARNGQRRQGNTPPSGAGQPAAGGQRGRRAARCRREWPAKCGEGQRRAQPPVRSRVRPRPGRSRARPAATRVGPATPTRPMRTTRSPRGSRVTLRCHRARIRASRDPGPSRTAARTRSLPASPKPGCPTTPAATRQAGTGLRITRPVDSRPAVRKARGTRRAQGVRCESGSGTERASWCRRAERGWDPAASGRVQARRDGSTGRRPGAGGKENAANDNPAANGPGGEAGKAQASGAQARQGKNTTQAPTKPNQPPGGAQGTKPEQAGTQGQGQQQGAGNPNR